MSATTLPTSSAQRTVGHRITRTREDMRAKLAGLGALGFVGVVVAQNLIRGGSAPANDASAQEVLTHYADHRSITFVLVATFVVSGVALSTFLGGVLRELLAGSRRGWAITGAVGAVGILALFALVVAGEQALSVVATHERTDLGAVEALWALHNSVFTVLDLFIAVALVGLSRAGVATGVTPQVFERLAPVGAALLLVGAVAGPALAAGDAMPLFGVAVLGFLVWLAFLVSTGLRLVRNDRRAA